MLGVLSIICLLHCLISTFGAIAVVHPFIPSNVPQIIKNWNSWSQEFFPCELGETRIPSYNATLIVYFAGWPDRQWGAYDGATIIRTLMAAWEHQVARLCFTGGIRFAFAGISEEITHPNGPCIMFYRLFDILEGHEDHDILGPRLSSRNQEPRYEHIAPVQNQGRLGFFTHFVLMEHDTVPIQTRWLDLLAQTSKCDEFWQKGSASRCEGRYGDNAKRADWHINGNAIYKLHSKEFAEFRKRVIDYYPGDIGDSPGCVTGATNEGGYDHTFYRYRLAPENYAHSQHVIHRFVYTDVIQNRCKAEYSAALAKENPGTAVVHSKWGTYTAYQKLIAHVLEELDSGVSHWPKQAYWSWHTKLWFGEWEYSDLYHHAARQKFAILHNAQRVLPTSLHFALPPLIKASPKAKNWLRKWEGKHYVWMLDQTPTRIMCNARLIHELGGIVHGEVDHPYCGYSGLCSDRRHLLDNPKNWNDPEVTRIDVIFCNYPAVNCAAYTSLNKTMVIYPTAPLEPDQKRKAGTWWKSKDHRPAQPEADWKQWAKNLRALLKNPRNLIIADNLYDLNAIKYWTGSDALHIPAWCGDSSAIYAPTRSDILIGPPDGFLDLCGGSGCNVWNHPLFQELQTLSSELAIPKNFTLFRLSDLYKFYELQSIAQHSAVVILPHHPSSLNFLQLYRLNIPLFVPSKSLMEEWHQKHHFIGYCLPEYLKGMADNSSRTKGDPPFLTNWLNFYDYYSWPRVQTFSSWSDLLDLLDSIDLHDISDGMREHNLNIHEELSTVWEEVLRTAPVWKVPKDLDPDPEEETESEKQEISEFVAHKPPAARPGRMSLTLTYWLWVAGITILIVVFILIVCRLILPRSHRKRVRRPRSPDCKFDL